MATIASLVALMQQMDEQYPLPRATSRLPTHWMKAMRPTSPPSEGRSTWPAVGPAADSIRSNWTLERTLL